MTQPLVPIVMAGYHDQYPVQSSKATAGGVAVAVLPALSPGQRWSVGIISVIGSSTANPTCQILLNGFLVSASSVGNGDSCSGFPPIEVISTDTLQVVWSGANVNDLFTACFFYRDISQISNIARRAVSQVTAGQQPTGVTPGGSSGTGGPTTPIQPY